MRCRSAALAVALLLALGDGAAIAAPMTPGLWETLTHADSVATPGSPSPVSRVCLSEQDVAKTLKTLPVPSSSCQSLNPVTGKEGTTSYDIVCGGSPPIRGKGSIATTATAYEGSMKLAIKTAPDKPDMPMNLTFAGRRVGDCPAAK
jgi:uncharacterized protein DUF3617